jgi:glycosyltransferase involved in cell wall biosynthesis
VQQSFPRPRPTTNPYLVQLGQSIAARPDAELRTFSWKTALLRQSDVFHVHWPEILVAGQSPLKALVRQVLTILLVVRLAVTRTPIVRTLHNLERPSGLSRRQDWILRLIERRTTLWILLNDQTRAPDGAASVLIPHGHYRDWYSRPDAARRDPRRIGFVGQIRRYKGVEGLVSAFRGLTGDLSLRIAGRPSSPEIADTIRALADGDERISLDLRFLDDDDLALTVRESSLIVLPYREMHNSGGVLAALSLDRPVLVPANPVNERLADEVGPGWVHQYEGDLEGGDILMALERATALDEGERPDLSARGWDDAGRRHLDAYRRAILLARHEGPQ